MTSLRDAIAARAPLRGPFLSLPTPATVEIVAGARPDFVCIDTEHSPIGDALLTDMIRAADLAGLPALVRVRSALPQNIAAALDAGAAGILVPHVATPEEAAAVVRAARFPPDGHRGAGPGRAAGYLRDIPGHVERARRETVVMVQIETVEAVARAPEILAVPGLDLAFIGPGDLAVDIAARGTGATLDALTDQVLAAGASAGLPVGIFTADAAASRAWLKRLSFVIQGSDAQLLCLGSDTAFAPLD